MLAQNGLNVLGTELKNKLNKFAIMYSRKEQLIKALTKEKERFVNAKNRTGINILQDLTYTLEYLETGKTVFVDLNNIPDQFEILDCAVNNIEELYCDYL